MGRGPIRTTRPVPPLPHLAVMITVGKPAPAFTLPSTSGATVSLSDFAGRKLVLYFYPRDNTPGCTREACDFRDHHAALSEVDAAVLGVSSDSLKSHAGFRSKFELPFDLLVDEGNKLASAFGAYGEKLMYGKKVKGVIRSTFLIDERGRIAAIWSPVKVDGHAQAVLAALTGSAAPAPERKPAAARGAKPETKRPSAKSKAASAKSKAASAKPRSAGAKSKRAN